MKKNRMMRLASVLLVAVLMTTCTISGTFAKYVTSAGSNDTARVAKWGVIVTGYSDMFKTEYATNDNDYTGILSVKSSNADKLVAPGTSGTLSQFTVTGTPEVAVRVTYDVTQFELNGWSIGNEYCPIIITVDGEDFYIGKQNVATVDALEAAVISKIEEHEQTYGPNKNLSEIASHGVAISWRWAFEGADHPWTGYQTDVKDTTLGNQAAAGTAATITLAVTCTVTQID